MQEGKEDELYPPDSEEIKVIYDDEEEQSPEQKKESVQPTSDLDKELNEYKEKYLRLYAEFENYKKRTLKDKEELAKYATESLIYDLLPSLDHLEIAVKHAENGPVNGLKEGVLMTIRELMRTLEKAGLKKIKADGMAFDPEFHHAIQQVERDDLEENMVVEEMRAGFIFGDKVLRATMVSVSKKSSGSKPQNEGEQDMNKGQ